MPRDRRMFASVAPLVPVRGICFLFSTNSHARTHDWMIQFFGSVKLPGMLRIISQSTETPGLALTIRSMAAPN